MTDRLARLPTAQAVFEGPADNRFIALSLEILIHDVSLVGDRETAMALGAYMEGEAPPPDGVPDYVTLEEDGRLTIANPPFLEAELAVSENEGYTIEAAFDSDLHLLIEPPIEVTYRGSLETVVSELEQTIATVYRTRGRHLEKLHEGLVDR